MICGTRASRSWRSRRLASRPLWLSQARVSRRMIEHYSHIRMDAKRTATDAIVDGGVNQNVNQPTVGDSTNIAKSLN